MIPTVMKDSKGILLVVSGAAGTGKGTVNASLMKNHPGYAFSVSATTREPRIGEVDGREYHFITKEQFRDAIKNGEMLEYTEYCGNYYGTPKSELKKLDCGTNLILEIETEGAGNIKRLFPDSVTVFILPPDYETLYNRLVSRGTNTKEDIENRMAKALMEFELAKDYDYIVVNRDGMSDDAADAIDMIVRSEKHRSSRLTDKTETLFKPKKQTT